MKKFLLILFAVLMLSPSAFAQKQTYNSKLQEAIWMYKKMNYTGCMQLSLDVVEDDPSNVLAYYYLAISTARLGNKQKAIEAYNKVIEINSSSQLSNYAKNGILCLEKPEECPSGTGSDSAKKAIDDVRKNIEQRKLDSIKDIINAKQDVREVPYEYMKDFKDFSKPQKKSESEKPTKEEIADALDTLKRAGYGNFVQPQNFGMSPEMMQMSMLMGSNGSNGMNAMMPYMMSMQNQTGEKMDPQVMQSMIMGSMMQDMYSNFGTTENK